MVMPLQFYGYADCVIIGPGDGTHATPNHYLNLYQFIVRWAIPSTVKWNYERLSKWECIHTNVQFN